MTTDHSSMFYYLLIYKLENNEKSSYLKNDLHQKLQICITIIYYILNIII